MHSLVINWHITQACNYSCKFCFSKWQGGERELILDTKKTEETLRELTALHALFPSLTKRPKLNIVGGEALIHSKAFMGLATLAKPYFDLSLITNGSLLSGDMVDFVAINFSMIGFSVDSVNRLTNRRIGRMDSKGRILSQADILAKIAAIRDKNPDIKVKINTVVNALNSDENLSEFICKASPCKWKVFQMLPSVNNNLFVDRAKFDAFVARHGEFSNILFPENNNDMRKSYLMIDPFGRFFQNHSGLDYRYSEPIYLIGINDALKQIEFDLEKFIMRYK